MAHADDDPVLVGFSSSRNASMHGKHEELGLTWGEWRAMTESERDDLMQEYVNELIDAHVEREEGDEE